MLRRTTVRPGGSAPTAADAVYYANRLTTLTHELANLLDGSLRCLRMAQRRLEEEDSPAAHTEAEARLETVRVAMEQMGQIVRAVMGSASMAGRLPAVMRMGRDGSLIDAIGHAVEVMRPLAEEKRIEIELLLGRELAGITAGPVYQILINGLRNSIEAIERAGGQGGGAIQVMARLEHEPEGEHVVIDVTDDGVGPPAAAFKASEQVYHHGFSTKGQSSGIGLSLSRELAAELGGTVELRRRAEGYRAGRPGALLRIRYPRPEQM